MAAHVLLFAMHMAAGKFGIPPAPWLSKLYLLPEPGYFAAMSMFETGMGNPDCNHVVPPIRPRL